MANAFPNSDDILKHNEWKTQELFKLSERLAAIKIRQATKSRNLLEIDNLQKRRIKCQAETSDINNQIQCDISFISK
jgi:hypothetical protein